MASMCKEVKDATLRWLRGWGVLVPEADYRATRAAPPASRKPQTAGPTPSQEPRRDRSISARYCDETCSSRSGRREWRRRSSRSMRPPQHDLPYFVTLDPVGGGRTPRCGVGSQMTWFRARPAPRNLIPAEHPSALLRGSNAPIPSKSVGPSASRRSPLTK